MRLIWRNVVVCFTHWNLKILLPDIVWHVVDQLKKHIIMMKKSADSPQCLLNETISIPLQVCILGVSGEQILHPSFLSWQCPPSLLLIHSCSKWSTHPLLLSCCHGNHHRVANGESQEKVQVRICLVAAAAAFCPVNLLKQLPVWNHLSFLLEFKSNGF